MAYVLPQVQVFQELQLVPQANAQPLAAFITGGHAALIRFAEADEKADGRLGFYESALAECFPWPNRPAGGLVDRDYVKVHIENALLKYFEDFIGSGGSIQTVAGTKNQVRAAATNWVANGALYPRAAVLKERDVKVGDIAKVRAVVGSATHELVASVAGFKADTVPAVVGNADADDANRATQVQPAPVTAYVGDENVINCVDISSVDDNAYNGLEDGDVNETYTLTVIQSSSGGDATTARLRVTSASGNDDVASVTPAAFGAPTTIGTRGLTVTFNDAATAACSLSAANNGVSDIDLLVGQAWTVAVGQAFTAPAATSGGTYAGDVDVTYIIEVTKGGLYAAQPEITVATDKGIDASGPTKVTAAAAAVAVGTLGVTVQFDALGLRKGDKYYIAAVAASDGAIKTLILSKNFPQAVQDNGATEVDVTLYIRKTIEVAENRAGAPGVFNYTLSDTEVCLEDGITALDASWTENGVPLALPVESIESANYGIAYVTVRYWLAELCSAVEKISDVGELDAAVSGPLHSDNELKWALFKALANNNGVPVSYASVCNPADLASWTRVLALIDGRDDTYGLVPLTRNKAVLDAFFAHVQSQSTELQGRWRVLWVNLEGRSEKVIVDEDSSSDGAVVMATLGDDPDTSGTQYTLLSVPAGNGDFVTNGVRAGDIARYLFTTDGFGGTTYTEFVIDAVLNEDTLRLVAPGHTSAVSVPQKLEVHRNLTATEQAEEIGQTIGFTDRRVRAVWPDTIGSGGLTFPGYHLCAALAAYTSGVVPHQGLTNRSIAGFDDVSRTVDIFNRTQLNRMAENGVWIVTQDLQTGEVFTRHAVTTGDTDDLNQREEQIVRNLDSISYFFQGLFQPYIGVSNNTDALIRILASELNAGIQVLRGRNFVERLGGQLVDAELQEIRRHTTLKDHLVVRLQLTLPSPLNVVQLHLVV